MSYHYTPCGIPSGARGVCFIYLANGIATDEDSSYLSGPLDADDWLPGGAVIYDEAWKLAGWLPAKYHQKQYIINREH